MRVEFLPTTGNKIIKSNQGANFGNLWATRGIDLSSQPGVIKLSPHVKATANSIDTTTLKLPISFIKTDAFGSARWVALTAGPSMDNDGVIFSTSAVNGVWSLDATSNTPTAGVDGLVVFGQVSGTDRMLVPTTTDIYQLANGTWTTNWWSSTVGGTALGADNFHNLHVFLNLLLVPDGNVIHTVDDSLVLVENRITLPDEYRIRWIRNDKRFAYISAENTINGEGLIFPWDGTSPTYDVPINFGEGSSHALAGVIKDQILHTINNQGELGRFNGNTVEPIAILPFKHTNLSWYSDLTASRSGTVEANVNVHPNGMDVIDDMIHINLSAVFNDDPTETALENMHSGIWAFDENVGLYHRFPVTLEDGGENNRWGCLQRDAGALVATRDVDSNLPLIVGAEVYSTATAQEFVICVPDRNDDTKNRGHIITSELTAKRGKAFYQTLRTLYQEMENSTDEIIVKYRTLIPQEFKYYSVGDASRKTLYTGTWSDTNTFTTTDSEFSTASVGDEIEIYSGEGSGVLAHITAISEAGGTYTVDIDETIASVSGTFVFKVMNWTKLGSISNQTLEETIHRIGKRGRRIQFKIGFIGTDTSPILEKLLVDFIDQVK